jgi:hypothetical protein
MDVTEEGMSALNTAGSSLRSETRNKTSTGKQASDHGSDALSSTSRRKLAHYEALSKVKCETRIAEVNLIVRRAQKLDICFLVDCTGSMQV